MDTQEVGKTLEEAREILLEAVSRVARKIGELLADVLEQLREVIDKILHKPKYEFVRSLIKPYKEPYIEVRYRARANL